MYSRRYAHPEEEEEEEEEKTLKIFPQFQENVLFWFKVNKLLNLILTNPTKQSQGSKPGVFFRMKE